MVSRRGRRRWFAAAALAVGVVLGLLLLEVGLRVAESRREADPTNSDELAKRLAASAEAELGGLEQAPERFSLFGLVEASPHRDVVYELKPNVMGTFRGEPIRTNVYGHRQVTTPELEKPEGVYRIVGLGDSHMFGWGVPQGETYLELLEQRLRAEGLNVEVINCAAPGYNTSMEVAMFEAECRAFDPDLVVLHWIGNDFDFPHFMQRVDAELTSDDASANSTESTPAEQRTISAVRWRTLGVLREVVQGRRERPSDVDEGEMIDGVPSALLPHSRQGESKQVRQAARRQYRDAVGEAGVRKALRRLAQLTSKEGDAPTIPVLVLMLGTGDESRQLVEEEALELGFEVLDAAPHFARALEERGLEASREVWRDEYLIPDDGHPTARAHLEYAEALLPRVLQIASGAGS